MFFKSVLPFGLMHSKNVKVPRPRPRSPHSRGGSVARLLSTGHRHRSTCRRNAHQRKRIGKLGRAANAWRSTTCTVPAVPETRRNAGPCFGREPIFNSHNYLSGSRQIALVSVARHGSRLNNSAGAPGGAVLLISTAASHIRLASAGDDGGAERDGFDVGLVIVLCGSN